MSHSFKHRRRMITVQIEPTLGAPFTMSCSPYLTVDRFKEDISDRLGISPKKMSLLYKSIELKTGMLNENGVQNGGEIKLVPCVESGVNTPLTMDPVAMMKHSMSTISDQQIDDFLAGKSPLSVAIRLGESVVVVNLNRAKVEEVELEPPPEKKSSLGSTSPTSSTRDQIVSTQSSSLSETSTEGISAASLNTNPHWSSSTTTCSHTNVTPPCSVPVRSVIPAGTPAPDSEGGSPATHLGKTMNSPDLLIHETSSSLQASRRRTHDAMESSSLLPTSLPSSPPPSTLSPSPLVHTSCVSSRPCKKAIRRSSNPKMSCTKHNKVHVSQSEWEELRRLREIPSSQNGVSMKRKAVMEAIGEILKKMYAQRVKGKVPGTFKGRFSSEFTCDNDMQEIIHSKTTMTSYGEMMESVTSHVHAGSSSGFGMDTGIMSKARFRENEQLRDKMAMLKWKMQQQKAMRQLKRQRTDNTSCDWMKEVECDLEAPPPKMRKKTGFCGLKRGFLLAD